MIKKNFIPIARPVLRGNEEKYLLECLRSGWISSKGKFITEFENRFSKFIGTSFASSTSNGTTALHLALLGLGIGPGDEVLVPAVTFAATAAAVTYVGATPAFVDIRPDTWNMDERLLEAGITPKTKAIIVVHLYGHPAPMDKILECAKKYNLKVIEDCAEAHGAVYKGKRVGRFGDVSCFSFFGNKIMTTGEGGMCLTDSQDAYERMELFKNHGMDPSRKYWHTVIGYNYRMTNMQAAIGLAQAEKIEELVAGRQRMARNYNSRLNQIKGLALPPGADETASPVYWMYTILLKDAPSRDALAARLAEAGVETRPMFLPLTSMPPYKKFVEGKTFSKAEEIAARGLSLPSSSDLKDDELNFISDEIEKFQAENFS